jgi:hypothetical protein
MINIDSDQGRIGELWWVNSDQRPVAKMIPAVIGILDLGMLVRARLIRWGTFGLGRHIKIEMESLDD